MIADKSYPYGFERHLHHASFDEALEKVTAALKQEGVGILDNPRLEPVVDGAGRRLRRVIASPA